MAERSETIELVIKAKVVGMAHLEKLGAVLAELNEEVGKVAAADLGKDLNLAAEEPQNQMTSGTSQKLSEYAAFVQAKADLDETYYQRRLEVEQRLDKEESGILQSRLNETGQVTGGLAGLFQDLYNLTGHKQREFFHLAKAASIAEATMNIYQGVTKALAQGGYYGYAMAAVVAAQGTAALGRILAQSLAAGGVVKGWSPHKTADNIPARLTAGEFVMPVDAVQKYGIGFFEALRRQAIPDDLVARMRYPALPTHKPAHAFASGGMVTSGAGDSGQAFDRKQVAELNIFNILDPKMLDQLMASKHGQNSMLNFMSNNAGSIRRVLGLR